MVIFYKNSLNIQIYLHFSEHWCIVFKQSVFVDLLHFLLFYTYQCSPHILKMYFNRGWLFLFAANAPFWTKLYCKQPMISLAFFWLFGFVSSLLYASVNRVSVIWLMLSALVRPVTYINLLVVTLLPLVILILIHVTRRPFLSFFLLFGKGFCVGFCLYSLLLTFGSAGWLIFSIFLFSDLFLLLPLFSACLICFSSNRMVWKKNLYIYLSLAFTIPLIDSMVLSPFAQLLIRYL